MSARTYDYITRAILVAGMVWGICFFSFIL